jgi:1,5-rhamnosyltransferase
MKVFFVGWSSDYDKVMIDGVREKYFADNIVLPAWLKIVYLVANYFSFHRLKREVVKTYVRIKLRGSASGDVIICKDSNFFSYIESIEKRDQKKILIVRNTVGEDFISEAKCVFDRVYTFDHMQSKKYNIGMLDQVFVYGEGLGNDVQGEGCFFIGKDKGRISLVEELSRSFESLGIESKFFVVPDKTSVRHSKLYVNKPMPYEEVVKAVTNSAIILEINQDGQSGLTMRALESIFLSKKLVTNNKEVINYDFYDPARVFVIENDVFDKEAMRNFVEKEYPPVEEHVLERYSPLSMMDKVLENE